MPKEKVFQIKFNQWLKHVHKKTGAFELKVARGVSLPFYMMKKHQEDALYSVKRGLFVYKIPDDSMGYKPFDCFSLVDVPAFVVILFKKTFYLIDIDDWFRGKVESKKSSITEEEVMNISTLHYTFR